MFDPASIRARNGPSGTCQDQGTNELCSRRFVLGWGAFGAIGLPRGRQRDPANRTEFTVAVPAALAHGACVFPDGPVSFANGSNPAVCMGNPSHGNARLYSHPHTSWMPKATTRITAEETSSTTTNSASAWISTTRKLETGRGTTSWITPTCKVRCHRAGQLFLAFHRSRLPGPKSS